MLLEANSLLHMEEAIRAPKEFVKLHEWVFYRVAYHQNNGDIDVSTAQAIIKRIQTRNLYKYVDEITIAYDQIDRFKEMKATDIAEAIFNCCPDTSTGGKRVRREDILVHKCNINMTFGKLNPVDNIWFYNHFQQVNNV